MKNSIFYLMILTLLLTASIAASGQSNDSIKGLVIGGVEWAPTNLDDYQTFAAYLDKSGYIDVMNCAGNPCPAAWRVATYNEWMALIDTGSSWADNNTRGNVVAGRFFGPNHATCSLPSNMSGCIFLPRAEYTVIDRWSGEEYLEKNWTYWVECFEPFEDEGEYRRRPYVSHQDDNPFICSDAVREVVGMYRCVR